MKITNWAILFVCIILPFYLVMDLRTAHLKTVQTLNHQYTVALRTAVQDAGVVLNANELQEFEAEYESEKYFKVNKELAVETFFRTMYLNFEVDGDRIREGALAAYIPAIIVMDYDSYHIYAVSEYRDAEGQIVYKHLWRPKKPYAYSDASGNIINFTLDGYVRAYEAASGEWLRGFQHELQHKTYISLLDDAQGFEAMRRSTIIKRIQEDLAYFINDHNEHAIRNGIHYTFKLPSIPQEEWVNTINDIGILAFVQGIPVGDQFYNNYAFGGGRLVKKTVIYGGIDEATGFKYYYQEGCGYSYRIEETFDSRKDAAEAGYFPKECVR